MYAISAIKHFIFSKGINLIGYFKRPVLFSLLYLELLFNKESYTYPITRLIAGIYGRILDY